MAYLDQVSYGGTLYDVNDTKGRAMIAPKEESSTASAAHAAGTYFTYNDLLYRATAAIAVGGTITPNTNCVAVTVGAETSELKSAIDHIATKGYSPISKDWTGFAGDYDTDPTQDSGHRNGYTANNGGWTVNNIHTTYYYKAVDDFDVFFSAYENTYVCIALYNGAISQANFVKYTRLNNGTPSYAPSAGPEIPFPVSEATALHVTAGQTMAISVHTANSSGFVLQTNSATINGSVAYKLVDGLQLSDGQFSQIKAALIDDVDAAIAPCYEDLTFPVVTGQLCWYDGTLYAANQDIQTTEEWTAAHWDEQDVAGRINQIQASIADYVGQTQDEINEIDNRLQYTSGDALTLPAVSTNDVDVTLNAPGTIFNGNGNFMDLFNITDGTYTVNSLEIVVSRHGSRISFNGTASDAAYMMLSDNTGASSGNLNRDYDLPLLPATFYVKKVSGSQSTVSTTINIRKDSTSNYFSIGLTNDITTVSQQISNNEYCRALYLYVNKNSTYDNFVIDLALGYTDTTGTTPNTTIVEGETASISSKGVVTATVSGTAIETVRFDLEDTMDRINALEDKTDKMQCFAQYRDDLSNEYATEGLYIYLPSKVGYIRQQFVHSERQEINADNWRMGFVYACDDNLNPQTQLTTSGEWECAVKLSGRSDYSGGIAHGDEVGTELIIFLDGEIVEVDSITSITPFKELRIVTVSNLYDPNDSTTVVALHGCERVYTADGIVVNQTLKWLDDLTVTSCYLAMLPVVKAVTSKYFTDENYTETNIPTNHSQVIVGRARKSTIYSEDAGFTSEFNTPIYPTEYTNGNYFLITDNGTDNYNKCYYAITNSSGSVDYEIPANTVWKTQTVYKMSMS